MKITGAPDHFMSKLPKQWHSGWISRAEAERRFKTGEEKKLQKLIANYLNLNGIYFEQERMDKRTSGKVGRPDFRCCFNGQFLAIECKANGEKLSDAQEHERARIVMSGGVFIVAYSLQDVMKFLWAVKLPRVLPCEEERRT